MLLRVLLCKRWIEVCFLGLILSYYVDDSTSFLIQTKSSVRFFHSISYDHRNDGEGRISKLQSFQFDQRRNNHRQILQMKSSNEEDVETATNIWETRRKMTKFWVQFLKNFKNFRYQYFPPSSSLPKNTSDIQNNNTPIPSPEEPDALTFISIVGIFLLPILLRLGGRFTIAELVGLNFLDEKIISQLTSFINFFQSLGEEKFLLLFGAWLVAKISCIDYLSLTIAIGSGILFEDVWIAALTSVICSTLASWMIFTVTRYAVGEEVQKDISKRPIVRALDRSCKQNGFKTVFSLRISPVIPIPIAAYNYLYAVSSVSMADFVAGITLGSIKPYLLDSYLGSFLGKSLLSGEGLNAAASEWVTLGIVGVLLLVGTFASQLVSSIWKEIQDELKAIEKEADPGSASSSSKRIDFLAALGVEKKDVPSQIITAQDKFANAWTRLKQVIEDEGKIVLFAGNSSTAAPSQLRGLPPYSVVEPSAGNDTDSRRKFEYEDDKLTMENMLDYTIESSIFTLALWSVGNELISTYTPPPVLKNTNEL